MNKGLVFLPLTCFLLINLGFSTTAVWGIPLLPGLAITWIFHWTIYRPQQFMPLAFVLTGCIYDLILDNPMGFTPLLFLGSYWIFYKIRGYIHDLPFIYIWASFALYSFFFGVFYWLLACLMMNHWVLPLPTFVSLSCVAILYPFLSRSMIFLQRSIYG